MDHIRSSTLTSIVNSIYDLCYAVVSGKSVLGGNRWRPDNNPQADFLTLFDLVTPHIEIMKNEGLLDSRVSIQAHEINEWFARRGFPVSLQEQGDPNTFYVGSIFEQMVKWIVSGVKDTLEGQDGKKYDAVLMSDGFHYYTSHHVSGPVVMIHTRDVRDRVGIVAMPRVIDLPFQLLQLAAKIQKSLVPTFSYGDLCFPMVNIDQEVDVSWLKGLSTHTDSGRVARLTEVVQYCELKVNETGALAAAATGMAVTYESLITPKPAVVFDQPFLLWISRNGCPLPTFAAWVDYTDWKNPGELK